MGLRLTVVRGSLSRITYNLMQFQTLNFHAARKMTSTDVNASIRQLEPGSLWNFFADLNAVPRASKKEAQVIEFAKVFGESLQLPTEIDAAGNVLIRKPATDGMEDRIPIVMQSHLDMVHQKNGDTDFDFSTQGIEMWIDGDWVKAKGTTLGADNGIGVATIMAILADKTISHPPLEALFTIDEETGMTGAKQLSTGWLQGDILLNLDTEEDDELTIGCAGGVDVSCESNYQAVKCPDSFQAYQLTVRGLQGGHSGMEIHLGLGNSNKIMNRLLRTISNSGGRIHSIEGGGLRNAIPRESISQFAFPGSMTQEFEKQVQAIKLEFATTDPELEIEIAAIDSCSGVLSESIQSALINIIDKIPNGVVAMSPAIEDLVETSNNLARIVVREGSIRIDCLARSSNDAARLELAHRIQDTLQPLEGEVTISGDYPGWAPDPDSTILALMRSIYSEKFDEAPNVSACHAGLECGLIGQHYPQMEMISFGPTIRGAHSPDERVSISSVKKFWSFVVDVLGRIPAAS